MTQDVEMKEKQVPATPSSSLSHFTRHTLEHFKNRVTDLILTGAYTGEVRRTLRAIHITIALRFRINASLISRFLNFALTPGSEEHSRLVSYIQEDNEDDTEVDTASSATQVTAKHCDELQIYCYLIVLMFLIDQKKYKEAMACSSAGIAWLKSPKKRTVDFMASRLYFYYSLSHELGNSLSEIRGNLLVLHQSATLSHDEWGQAMLLNLILRNYLHYNLYDQAQKLISKAPLFTGRSNRQFCRYLFYLGKIKTIKLEYTDAKESLLQAALKAPLAARFFRAECNKWVVIVRLFLGEIPERTFFMQKDTQKALRPYFELTNAVRLGDLDLFKSVAEKFSTAFTSDRTRNLIVRLRHNVIRTRLRHISISYSRISLADLARKLRLESHGLTADVEGIVSKAIRDGAIDAMVDHANGWMVCKEAEDVYSTNEPKTAFDSRICFCLNVHNEAVCALKFPPDFYKWKESEDDKYSDDEYYDDYDEYYFDC